MSALILTHAELRERLRDPRFLLVDVLPRDHFTRQHIPGAISLPYDEIEGGIRQVLPDRTREFAVYCAGFT